MAELSDTMATAVTVGAFALVGGVVVFLLKALLGS